MRFGLVRGFRGRDLGSFGESIGFAFRFSSFEGVESAAAGFNDGLSLGLATSALTFFFLGSFFAFIGESTGSSTAGSTIVGSFTFFFRGGCSGEPDEFEGSMTSSFAGDSTLDFFFFDGFSRGSESSKSSLAFFFLGFSTFSVSESEESDSFPVAFLARALALPAFCFCLFALTFSSFATCGVRSEPRWLEITKDRSYSFKCPI